MFSSSIYFWLEKIRSEIDRKQVKETIIASIFLYVSYAMAFKGTSTQAENNSINFIIASIGCLNYIPMLLLMGCYVWQVPTDMRMV